MEPRALQVQAVEQPLNASAKKIILSLSLEGFGFLWPHTSSDTAQVPNIG